MNATNDYTSIPYANREEELKSLSLSISNENIIILLANNFFGVSSFLTSRIVGMNIFKSFYIDITVSTNPLKLLLSEIMADSEGGKILQVIANSLWGERSSSILSNLIKEIPYAGGLLSTLLEKKSIANIYTGDYSCVHVELLQNYLLRLAESQDKHILLIIDNAQKANENILSFFRLLNKLNSKIHILFTITDTKSAEYLKLKNSITIEENKSPCEIQFSQPTKKLVCEIAKLFNKELDNNKAEYILLSSNYNIHQILQLLTNDKTITVDQLSLLDKEIISLLSICYYGLSMIELTSILLLNEKIYHQHLQDEVNSSILKLKEYSLIKQKHTRTEIYTINGSNNPISKEILNEHIVNLYNETLVLEYFNNKSIFNLSYDEIMLGYRIAKKHNFINKTTNYARCILKKTLCSGENLKNDIFNDAQLNTNDYNNIMTAAIYYSKQREFSNALACLEKNNNCNNHDYNKLKAVLLDRVRRLDESIPELNKCIEKENDKTHKAILLSYLATSLLHSNKIKEAQELFIKWNEKLKGCRNYGYFLRTMASAFCDGRFFLEEALLNFKLNEDDFGYYSTLCNYGYSLMIHNQILEAYSKLEEAENGLKKYGTNMCHIIYNDLGVCLLLMKDSNRINDAIIYFKLSIVYSKNKMPRLFANINLACCYAFIKQTDKAVAIIRELEKEVDSHELDRVREKYYANRIFLEYASGNMNLKDFIELNELFPDRYAPERSHDRCLFYQKVMENNIPFSYDMLTELYSPCGLVYWFVDPLKLLSNHILDYTLSV